MQWIVNGAKSQDVFVLGAGFSIAATGTFPDTNALGNACWERDPARDWFPGWGDTGLSFEQWLSRLAEPQPFDSDEAKFRRRALFVRIQDLIGDELSERLRQLDRAALPEWLFQFVDTLHASRATVITLNYDTLLEDALDTVELRSRNDEVHVNANRAMKYIDIPRGSWDAMGPRSTSTFNLFKLHGSIDWHWVPGDITGSSLIRAEKGVSAALDAQIGGRARFIVPPTTRKSDYFENATSRYMWQQSALALTAARRVFFVGYSIPLADTAVATMLAERISSEAEVYVVDRNPEPVKERLRILGFNANADFPGVEGMVSTLVGEKLTAARNAAAELAPQLADAPVAAYWHENAASAVVAAQLGDNVLILNCEDEQIGDVRRMNRHRTSDDTEVVTAAQLADLLPHAATIELVAGDRTWPVVDARDSAPGLERFGHADRWLLLRGSGRVGQPE